VKKLYDEVSKLLGAVDFEGIWAGFSPFDFALFDKQSIYMTDKTLQWDERFLGNTAIEFEGKFLAIWEITSQNDGEVDVERLVSGIVHEMFHALQKQQGDRRWVDELAFLNYPYYDIDNANLKIAEMHYLMRAFSDGTHEDLVQFVALRNARRRIIGNDIFTQEMMAETIEGMAEYAGLMTLNQLNRAKFVEDVSRRMDVLRSPDMLLKPRLWAYSSGALLCLALKTLGINFHHHLSDIRPLFDFVPKNKTAVETAIREYKLKLRKIFDDFLKKHTSETKINATLTGYDPMNMQRLDDNILCTRFVMLDGIYIEGPVMLHMEKGSKNQVVSYTK